MWFVYDHKGTEVAVLSKRSEARKFERAGYDIVWKG